MLLSPEGNVALISDDSITIDGKAVRFMANEWKILYTYLDKEDEDGVRDYELTFSINNDQEVTRTVTVEYQKEKSYTVFSTTKPKILAVKRISSSAGEMVNDGDYWYADTIDGTSDTLDLKIIVSG
jgi:hypothetical protein